MYDDGASDFSPVQPDVQRAAQGELDRRKQMQAQEADAGKAAIGDVGGVIGAIISTYATGNPLIGWSAGKGLGDKVAGRQNSKMPGLDQLQAVFKAGDAKQAPAPEAAAAAPEASSEAPSLTDLWGGGA